MSDQRGSWRPKIASKARLRFDTVEKRHLLVFPEAALALNEPSAAVLKLCDGERTVEAIIDGLVETFGGANKERIASDVLNLLERLRSRGLLEV